MSYGRVHCQVLETPAQEEWLPHEQDWPRDLLPWADPYIAVLMLRLERRYDWADEADDSPFAADDAPHRAVASDSWQGDAFRPGRHERRRSMFPPMYGGFPLLDDVTDGLEEDPV
jgi:hypothetical protein